MGRRNRTVIVVILAMLPLAASASERIPARHAASWYMVHEVARKKVRDFCQAHYMTANDFEDCINVSQADASMDRSVLASDRARLEADNRTALATNPAVRAGVLNACAHPGTPAYYLFQSQCGVASRSQ